MVGSVCKCLHYSGSCAVGLRRICLACVLSNACTTPQSTWLTRNGRRIASWICDYLDHVYVVMTPNLCSCLELCDCISVQAWIRV